MKKLFLLFTFFILTQIYSQNKEVQYDNLIIENKMIIWQKIYLKDSINNIKYIKKKLSLVFINSHSGTASNQELNCKSIAIYANALFSFNFEIDEKKDKYRIRVSNIVFNNDIQLDLGSVITSIKVSTLEEFELKKSDYTFRKNKQSMTNMQCLDNFLLTLFNTKDIKKDW